MIVTKFDSAAFIICCCVTVTLKKGVACLIKALAIYDFSNQQSVWKNQNTLNVFLA